MNPRELRYRHDTAMMAPLVTLLNLIHIEPQIPAPLEASRRWDGHGPRQTMQAECWSHRRSPEQLCQRHLARIQRERELLPAVMMASRRRPATSLKKLGQPK